MLTIHHLNKSFGITTVLRDISFSANQHEKIGLLGPNGCGKTTLLRMIAGVDRPDSGSIQFTPGDTRVGYLPQGFKFAEDQTIQSFLNEGLLDTQTLAGQFEEVSTQLGHFPDDPDLHDQFDRLLGQLNEASSADVQVKPVLSALNLAHLSPDTPVGILSGGQKTRLGLAKLLLSNPDLLLLDEPTNHLDLEMLEWLENWLIAFPSTAIIVSHDRIFLDRVVTSIYEIAPRTHRGKMYAGNYSAYAEQKADEWEQHWQEYTDQQDEIFHLRQTANHLRGLAQFKKGGKADSGDKFAKGFFANRGLETMGRAKQIERRLERLVTDEKIDKPKPEWEMKMEFSAPPESSRTVLSLEECVIGYGGNILLEDINLTVRYGQRIAMVGANGSGKSSLIKTIMGQVPILSGAIRIGASVKIGYMAQEQDILDQNSNPYQVMMQQAAFSETEARAYLSQYLFKGDAVFTPVRNLSFGERARLMLACLVAQGCNFLLLDEPINHLDIPSRSQFEQALSHFQGTVMAVVHDRYFISRFATEIWAVNERSIRRIERVDLYGWDPSYIFNK